MQTGIQADQATYLYQKVHNILFANDLQRNLILVFAYVLCVHQNSTHMVQSVNTDASTT